MYAEAVPNHDLALFHDRGFGDSNSLAM